MLNRRVVLLRRIRWLLTFFILALVASGLTAFPLQWETETLADTLGIAPDASANSYDGLQFWIATVRDGIRETYTRHPFMAYGTDWLAFAHLVIAVAFVGPWLDPVRNRWVLTWGLIACGLVIPLALICGPLRGIPFYWRLIDCSFGVVGAVPLWFAHRAAKELETLPVA